MLFTWVFWRAAFERAVKTGGQFALLTLGVGFTAGAAPDQTAQAINAFALNYVTLAGAIAGGILVSLLTSVATAVVTDGNPSANNAELLNPRTPA